MRAHVLLNLLNEFWKKDKMLGLCSNYLRVKNWYFFSDVKNWYQIFINMKIWYQIRVKNQ